MLHKPGGDREMVDILALVLHHDEQAVLTAVELALTEGVPTKTHVLNLLHRLNDGKVVDGPPLDSTEGLRSAWSSFGRYPELLFPDSSRRSRHLASDGPDEPRQFARDCDGHGGGGLASAAQAFGTGRTAVPALFRQCRGSALADFPVGVIVPG